MLVTAVSSPAFAQIVVRGGFEGSNVVDVRQTGAGEFSCRLASPTTPALDSAWYTGGSHYHDWFMLKVEDAAGQAVTITITNADWGSDFFEAGKDPVFAEVPDPNALAAETQWQRITSHSYASPNYTFTFTPATDLAWVALSYPALPSHTINWVATYSADARVTTEVLLTTTRGWPLYALWVTNPGPAAGKRGVLVYGQEHNNEQDGGWTCQGLVAFLTSGDAVAETLLDNTIFIVLPDIAPNATAAGSCMDPDTGRASHHFNPAGLDRFMPGSGIPLTDEAAVVWDRLVDFVDNGGVIDLAINIHQGGLDNVWGMYQGCNTAEAEPRAKSFDDHLQSGSILPGSGAAWVPSDRQGYSRGGWQSIDLPGWPTLRLFGRCWEEWRTVPLGYELSVGSRDTPTSNFLADVSGLTYFGEALARATFEYYGGFARSIAITSPNGGESFASGAATTVTWNSAGGVGNVRIDLSVDNGASWTPLAADTPNDGTEAVTLAVANSARCLVRVSELAAFGVTDTSASLFTLGTPPAGSLAVTSPSSGDVWRTRWEGEVSWTSTGSVANVEIEISTDNGASWRVLGTAVPNTGSYLVNVPNAPSTQCLIRINGLENPGVTAVSGTFTIEAAPPLPTLVVTSPNGGEVWMPSGTETVTWTGDASVANVGMSISLDGGANWSVLVASTPNDGTEDVSVPATESFNCRLWIYDVALDPFFTVADRSPTDTSDAAFLICDPGGATAQPEDCYDGLDNDCDGLVDDVDLEDCGGADGGPSSDGGAPGDPAPGDGYAPGDAYTPGDVYTPGDASAPGDVSTPGDASAPGDTYGDAYEPGDSVGVGDAGTSRVTSVGCGCHGADQPAFLFLLVFGIVGRRQIFR